MAVLLGLRTKTRFWWSVHEDGPATYQEFLARAEKHISAEEATSDQENDRSDRRDNVKSKEKNLKTENKESPKKALEFQYPGRPRPASGYHVLNTSLENVLMKTKGKDILKKPFPMRASSSELNQRKYYRYHRSTGHDTYDCRDLEGEIESLIRRGHLKEFLVRPSGEGEPSQPQNRTELPPPLPPPHGRGKIHMIVGGSQHLEGSRRQRRKLSREAHTSYQVLSGAIYNPDAEKFSFSKEDASHVLQPHSNALVITTPVSGIDIYQTLVDDGSSMNVLYLRTFEKMEIVVQHVRTFSKPLQGFTGDSVNLKGQIALVVELELPPCHRRIIVVFVITDLPSNYNAILGQPILHELKAAASIYHYAIKFPTSHGVGIVRGSQLVARSCNITFLRVGVDMLQAEPKLPARRSDMDKLEEDPVEDLGLLDPRCTYTSERPSQ
ncbi:reverse transcriptase [Abeliophyllum distichum]|uniref:Reverse transcriptase n=1 Tax=Abeliophyllum distichum TaxID=126358 RepID=A0ABD1RFW5_9LAMI